MTDNIYAKAESDSHIRMWKRLLERGTVKQIADKLHLSSKQLYRWKEGEACYPLSAINKLSEHAKMKPEFEYIRTKYDSEPLFQPKIEQELNQEFSEFLGHLLYDGGIDLDWRVHYTSDEDQLLDRFRRLVETCFGKTLVKSRPSGAATTLYYPAIIGVLLAKNFGLPKGSKVKSDVGIPKSVKAKMTTRKLVVPFVAAAYFCDGESGRARMALASRETSKPPKLLEDFRDLLARLNFMSARISPSSEYETLDGVHRRWVLSLADRKEGKRFHEMIQSYRSAIRLDLQS